MVPLAFGECVFYRERRELICRGRAVVAGPKLLGLLELLLDARPRALTKNEIHQQLWGGTFVSDATLTSLIAELRSAIGDQARESRLVRTIHGYGYAFCGEVAPATPAPGAGRGPRHPYRIIVGDREIPLPRGRHVLGRSNEVTVFVDDAGVSRHHAQITIDDRGATLEDLGSKNGTVLNGSAIAGAASLGDGAVIVLGATALKFRVFTTSGSTDTVSI